MSDKNEHEIKHEKTQETESDAKAKDLQQQILRLHADFDNTKKRLEKDKQEAIRFSNERLLIELLPVMDTLDRAMASLSEGHDPEKVKQGLKIAQSEMHELLEQHGVTLVKSVGQEFDPNLHEAVTMVETQDAKDGSVIDEIQKGYLLNGRLLRPSLVKVAKKIE